MTPASFFSFFTSTARALCAASASLLLAAAAGCGGSAVEQPATAPVERGEIEVWTPYPGKIEARRVEVILSRFNGNATIVEMAAEGAQVQPGDLLVRFDSSQIERDLLKIDRDAQLARTDLERMEMAELPLQLRELEAQLLEASGLYEAERQYLEDSHALLAEDLISAQELEQQKLKVEELAAKRTKIEVQLDLTRRFLHPSTMSRARATLTSAEQELVMARQQLSNCTVTAPSAGVVVYRPLHVGGEYRTARVGDTIFKNQPFMILPDMRELAVECQVPEAELARVEPGHAVQITPISYPDLVLTGRVETVGSMAAAVADRPSWQRFFRVVIALERADERLRPSMAATARILAYRNPDALLAPRAAVRRDSDKTYVLVSDGKSTERRAVRTGWADARQFEILEGLSAGETVVVE